MRGDSAKSESRRFPEYPRREKPEEPPVSDVLNTRSTARDSRKGRSPGAAACHTVPSLRRCDSWPERRQVGSAGRLMTPATFREGNAPIRDAPKGAVGVKQNRLGLAGSKPARGWSRNPEVGTKRAGKTREMLTRDASMCQGAKSP